jgi:hypothetical protein
VRRLDRLPYGWPEPCLMEWPEGDNQIEEKNWVSDSRHRDAILDECLALLRAAEKPKTSRLGLKWAPEVDRHGYLDRLVDNPSFAGGTPDLG